ncbi:MAG: autoinducer binding domain-containing protein [Rhodobacteraceae bacterium]|nr:autoinducer binding domain-containing protein [Paracoccaceae bacterium]
MVAAPSLAARAGNSPSLPDVAALLARILAGTDAELIWEDICNFFGSLGFEHLLYGYSPDSRGAVLGAPEDYLILTTLPKPVVREMIASGYFRLSVTFNWALNNVGLASWSMTAEEAGMPQDFAVPPDGAEFFLRHGLLTGCSIGFAQERTRGRAVMALIAPPSMPQSDLDSILDEWRDVVFTVAAVAHRCLSALPYLPPGRRLTHRQREVMEWVAEGKTTADIALIMGITPPTVEKHLRLARETLGVETTPHALVKATFLNQMFVASPQEYLALKSVSAWHL